MPRIYVSVGSNVEREHHIRAGVAALGQAYGPLIISSVYESEAVGFEGDDFYNLVVGFDTEQSLLEVAQRLRSIEAAHSRSRGGPRFGPRTLDLDLLLYDDLVTTTEGLRVPRAEITRYAFVLEPLSEIAGERRHPETGERFDALWAAFEGPAMLRPIRLEPPLTDAENVPHPRQSPDR